MTGEATVGSARAVLDKIVSLGDSPQASEEQLSANHFLIYMGLLMSAGGLVWGSMSLAYGLYVPSLIPYGYAVLTAINFAYFRYSKRFEVCRFVQVLISMLLPFLLQWSLGGFIPSGAVMLWALISLAGSLTFQDARLARRWLVAFLALTVVSGLIDSRLEVFQVELAPQARTLFFVLNISVIATIVFVLNAYLLAKRDEATAKVAEMSSILKQMFGRYLSTEVMNSLIEMTTDHAQQPGPLTVGDAVPLDALTRHVDREHTVRLPDRRQVQLAAGQATFAQTVMPGVYTVPDTTGAVQFAVNLSAAESKTGPFETERLENLGVRLSAGDAAATPADRQEAERQLRARELEQRQKVWRWLIVAVLALIALETWLAAHMSNQSATAPERDV